MSSQDQPHLNNINDNNNNNNTTTTVQAIYPTLDLPQMDHLTTTTTPTVDAIFPPYQHQSQPQHIVNAIPVTTSTQHNPFRRTTQSNFDQHQHQPTNHRQNTNPFNRVVDAVPLAFPLSASPPNTNFAVRQKPAKSFGSDVDVVERPSKQSNWWGDSIVSNLKKAANSVVSVLAEPDEDELNALMGLDSVHNNQTVMGRIVSHRITSDGYCRYQCGMGDTFAGIASRFNMPVSDLIKINRISSSVPLVGQILIVRSPAPYPKPTVGSEANTPSSTTTTTTVLGGEGGRDQHKQKWAYEVLTAHALYLTDSSKIPGVITLSSSMLVFDNSLANALPFQLHIPITAFVKSNIEETDTLSVSVRSLPQQQLSDSSPLDELDDSGQLDTHVFQIKESNAEEWTTRLHTRIHVLMVLHNQQVKDSSHPMNQCASKTNRGEIHVRSRTFSASRTESPERDIYLPTLNTTSDFLTTEHIQKIVRALPVHLQFCDWYLYYSLQRHGVSLGTFFRSTEERGPSVIFIKDSAGHLFGGFASESWRISSRYYGTGESFLFRLHPQFRAYHWSRKNEFFMLSTHDGISMGGGGHHGFSLDNELLQGSSDSCETFDCPCLASTVDFQCVALEVWGFQKPKPPVTKRL